MPVATILKNNLSQRKIMLIAASIGIPLLIAITVVTFFLIQGTTTEASDEAPFNVNAAASDGQSAQITFQTGKETIAIVEYGISPDALTEVSFGDLESMDHTIEIGGLEPNTTYYFRIRSGDTVYDNDGALWSFTTPTSTDSEDPSQLSPTIGDDSESASLSPTDTTSPSETIAPTPTPTASPSASITATPSATIAPTPIASISATITSSTSNAICKSNNCVTILGALGTQCTTQDYVKCLMNVNVTITQQPTKTPTPTPITASVKSQCSISYFQPNSCTSWIWDDMTAKPKVCSDTFTKYFVQCKSTSWSSTDPAIWYCNETVTSNQLSLPCATAPTPAPGQSIFCRVRAEANEGGADNATDWVYSSSSCGRISGDDPNCGIDYVQGNSCTSWIWDFDYQKDPRCKDKFDHYFLQCTDDGLFNSSSFWYCNTTTTDHYLDLPCYNAAIPGDGMPITCRVRAEDGYGDTSHVSSWATGSSICPTSTPTPTPSPTQTPTPTNTPTPTP